MNNVQMNSPRRQFTALAVLLVTGLLLAVTTNLAKVSNGMGISPVRYLTWSLLGATLILFAIAAPRGQLARLNRRSLEYFIVAGFLSTAGANLIFFNAVPRLGVSFVAMMIALPPLFTYVGALALRLEQFCWWRAAGVLMALAGTALLVAKRWRAPGAEPLWISLTLLGPVLLAAGNLYRSWRWPPGASAESLAPGMLAAAAAMLLVYALATGAALQPPASSAGGMLLVAIQAGVFAGQFLLMFLLQKIGGPVFLSMMGGVSAVFGVPIAMGLLGEPALPGLATSALLVAAGIGSLLKGNAGSGEGRASPAADPGLPFAPLSGPEAQVATNSGEK